MLAVHCPADEYDIESRDIALKLIKDNSIDEAASICSAVFTHWFGENFPIENFIEIAEEIKSEVTSYHA